MMKKTYAITMLIILIGTTSLFSQVSINSDGSEANTSAMLDIVSTTKGMLIPRMTTTQRTSISNAANGLLVFDETTASFWFYKTATGWEELSSGSSSVSEIDDLSDAINNGLDLFMGAGAGTNNSGLNNNLGIGSGALFDNTSGAHNSAMGYSALTNNTTGTFNVALGSNSQISNTTGLSNISIGQNSLYYNSTGSNNIAIGKQAGYGSSGNNYSGNIFIGYQAGYNESGSNKLYIENSNSSSPLIGGDFSTNVVDINGRLNAKSNLYVTGPLYAYNTITAAGSLTANNLLLATSSVRISSGNPGTGKVLTSDASGYATWQTPSSSGASVINELNDAKTSNSSVYLGASSGINSSGSYNTGTGYFSLNSSTSNGHNTAYGFGSSRYNTTGSFNTSIGSEALQYNQTGYYNTAIGYRAGAGSSAHSKSGNIFIGYMAGYYETGSNKLYIDNSSVATPLIGGDFSSNYVDINGRLNAKSNLYVTGPLYAYNTITASGTLTANSLLLATNTVRITSGNPGAGKVLTSDASGNATWQSIATPTISIDDLTDGKTYSNSVYLGVNSGNNSTATNNSTIGSLSQFSNTSGNYNTSVGSRALYFNTTGSNNTAIGFNAGAGATSHSKTGNVFIGYSAGYNETGSNKLYIANSNTTTPLIKGDFASNILDIYGRLDVNGNIIISGTSTLNSSVNVNGTFSTNNTINANSLIIASGLLRYTYGTPGTGKVLTSDASGNATWQNTGTPTSMSIDDLADGINDGNSIFIGINAGANDDDANNNVGIGNNNMNSNTSGSLNTSVGYNTLFNNTSGIRNSAIGYQSVYANSTGNYNTAIGYYSLRNTTGSSNTAVGYNASPTSNSAYYTTSIGFGSHATANYSVMIGSASNTWIGGNVTWSTTSDKRFKNQIKENVTGLDFIMKLRPVTYHYNINKMNQFKGVPEDEKIDEAIQAKEAIQYSGFIAQEVEAAAQEVNYDFSGLGKPQNEKDHYSLAYAEFVVPLVKAVQEQQVQIEKLQQENKEIKSMLVEYNKLINQQKK